MPSSIVLIPARMQATRLPGKPLADIHGEPMIVHVWRRAMAAEAGRVVVATDSEEIRAAVRKAGGEAVMTRADHVSGSDRIFEALNKVDPDGDYDTVVNLQGDLPTLEPHLVTECLAAARGQGRPHRHPRRRDPGAGRAHRAERRQGCRHAARQGPPRVLRALYFTRATAPYGDGPLYHHIGIYAYRRIALERFVSLPPSPLELREKLEQLRALEDGMRIDVALVDTVPLGVDTPADLERARCMLSASASRRG